MNEHIEDSQIELYVLAKVDWPELRLIVTISTTINRESIFVAASLCLRNSN